MKINHDINGPGKLEMVFYKLGILAIIGLGVLMSMFAYKTFYPRKLIEVTRFSAVSDSVKRGSMLTYRLDICKYVNKTATIHRALINDIIIALPTIEASIPTGCQTVTRKVMVPEYAPTGEYILRATVDFEVNSFKTISYAHETGIFQVTE